MDNSTLETTPLEWVRAFEAAGRTGSFTAAAKDLNLTQAAVSQRIGQLEARIGRPLFIRGARGITLTVDGEAWLPHVAELFQNLRDSYADIFGAERKRLTISASASVIELWLVRRLDLWPISDRPEIVFSTRVLPSAPQQRDAILRIEYGAGNWPDQRKSPLFKEVLCPVASPSLIGNTEHWSTLPRISISGPRLGWQAWCNNSGMSMLPLPKLRFDSFAAGLAAALAGEGVLLASLPLCRDLIAAGKLVQLSTEALEPNETYWMYAEPRDITKSEWETLQAYFTSAD
jgi:LysR family glycine cleavage system transcriptional activator